MGKTNKEGNKQTKGLAEGEETSMMVASCPTQARRPMLVGSRSACSLNQIQLRESLTDVRFLPQGPDWFEGWVPKKRTHYFYIRRLLQYTSSYDISVGRTS